MLSVPHHPVYYILIVDDDPDDHFLLRKSFGRALPQAIIESVYDGSAVNHFLLSCPVVPDLIVLDLNMSLLSGKETLKWLATNERFSKVPVVIYTTSRSESEKLVLRKMGAVECYTKPNDNAGIDAVVEDIRNRFLFGPMPS